MTISYISAGTQSGGTSSVTVAYPASVANGDMLVLAVANKYPTNGPARPSGWNPVGQASGGAGASGADSGSVYSTVFFRIADGSETSTMDVFCPSGNSMTARIARYTKSAAETWFVSDPSVGSFTSGTTAWSVTGDAILDLAASDRIVAVSAANADPYTFSLEAIAIPGVVIGNQFERVEGGTTNGDDCYLTVSDHAVTSGTSSGVPVYTMTSTGSSAGVSPAGATVIFRLRAAVVTPARSRLRLGMGISL